MNDFSKLQQLPISITAYQFLHTVSQSHSELERLNHNTRNRIVQELIALSQDTDSGFNYDKMVKLIQELKDYGYVQEATVAMNALDALISELNPGLLPWLKEQMKQFDIELTAEKATGIFIERHYESENKLYVTWCYNGLQDAKTANWHNSCILMDDMIEFVKDAGLYHQVDDLVDHCGNHVQRELRRDIYTYVQEEIEFLIKKYMASGKARTEL